VAIIDVIVNFRRFLKRRNHSPHTVKNYLNRLKHFVVWLNVPLEEVTQVKVLAYIDHLLDKRLKPSTINYHLLSVRQFYDYLAHEEGVAVGNPVRRGNALRLPRPLPRCLKEADLTTLFGAIKRPRDRALFLLMLRSGLRVEEVANLSLEALDLTRGRLLVHHGKGGKDRVYQPGYPPGSGGVPAAQTPGQGQADLFGGKGSLYQVAIKWWHRFSTCASAG
jgi:site-specific recombinase XerD